jgi:hypothetical protein
MDLISGNSYAYEKEKQRKKTIKFLHLPTDSEEGGEIKPH